ncbi:glycosyl transferase group 1 [Desulfurella amilsii]|uniref:Glycosyl transferase group 1 n=1 Tax=Desulfurella amilsii TaxID=1562698 RepID=A0A1X4XV51_9BACT|nr:glycosyltransferase [Desulfurella amilsii]OSS41419.1 glycosyl transferase group 1 [Desulfurella amilsii]
MQNNQIYEKNCKNLKVLFINRKDYLENLGGDTIQMLSIINNLNNQIISDIQTDPLVIEKIIPNYDIIHIFNIQRLSETAFFVKLAKRYNKKIVISPIYADFSTMEEKGRSRYYKLVKNLLPKNFFNLAKDANRVIRGLSYAIFLKENLYNFDKLFKNTLNACDCIVPNSIAEKDYLKSFMSDESKIKVIRNGVDENFLINAMDALEFRQKYKINFDNFVLCVARIDERKNILNLLKATFDDDSIKIVLIGKVYPTHKEYYKKCLRYMKPDKVMHINTTLPQNEICGAYKCAHTHALVSWLETPGLASLEAGLFGANLVIGKCDSTKEYFENYAYFCESGNLSSIYSAIKQSLNDKRNHFKADEFIKKSYSWQKISQEYLEVYSNLLKTS